MMRLSSLWDRTMFLLSVPKCVCCNERLRYGSLALCPECYAKFKEVCSRNCSRCAANLAECSCSNSLMESAGIKRVVKVFRYTVREQNDPANYLIYSLKRDNRRDVLDFCSSILSGAILNTVSDFSDVVFTNVPRRRSAVRERGIDHAALLARAIARELKADYMPLLISKAKRSQKTLSKEDRRKNARFELKKQIDLTSKRVIVIDDVITSGASMAEAAMQIKRLHPKEIISASLAIAYRDKYIKPLFSFN